MGTSDMELLLWVRGSGFTLALTIFLFGIILRGFEIFGLGRNRELTPGRIPDAGSPWRTVWGRFIPIPQFMCKATVTYVGGWLFHAGYLMVLFFYLPHIEMLHDLTGFSWPAFPTPLLEATTVVALLSMLVLLVDRRWQPVKRFLSTAEDYLVWTLTFLPLLTGWFANHHLLFPYTLMLALHILSVELLLIALPFTKLMHTFTAFSSRWYTGVRFRRRGVVA